MSNRTPALQITRLPNWQPQHFRLRLIACGWVVVRRRDGLRKSIPVYRRHAMPITRSEARQ